MASEGKHNPRKAGFLITGVAGFHLRFANGELASVQWGPGCYGDHHMTFERLSQADLAGVMNRFASTTAEVMAHGTGSEGGVWGYLTADEVLDVLVRTALRNDPQEEMKLAVWKMIRPEAAKTNE